MIAVDDPLIRKLHTRNPHDDVVQGANLPVERELQVDLRGARAGVVRHRKAATPRFWRDDTLEIAEQRQRVGVRDRQHRNLHQRGGFAAIEPATSGLGAPSRRERIAGFHGQVDHAAALHPVLRSPRALSVRVALKKSVVARIRIDDAGDGSVLGSDLRLDPAPAMAVAREHDLPLHVDVQPGELLVVLRNAIVHIHEVGGDVTVSGVRVERRQLSFVGRVRVGRDRRLLQGSDDALRPDQFERALDGVGEQSLGRFDRGIETPRFELVENVLGDLAAAGTAGVMRLLGDRPHVLAQPVGARRCPELALERPLTVSRRRGKSANALWRLRVDDRGDQQHGCERERGTPKNHAESLLQLTRATREDGPDFVEHQPV